MEIKIYFLEKPVYLCDALNASHKALLKHPDTVFIDEVSTPAIHALLHEIAKDNFHAGILLSPDLQKLKKMFFRNFKIVEAAGGIVQNENKEILFIYRRNKWDLPKGKIEKKELPENAAAREIEEETGIKNLYFKKKIGSTFHIYNEYGKSILKETHWFYFTSPNQEAVPQTEEDITEVKWFKTRDIKVPASNTYENIKEILHRFFDEP
ncbi:MAG: NUDIX domain-containing protein [Ferruginibacter sp.]